MKKILGILLASALLWSCGSQFSKSKYDRYMWNRSAGKADKTVNIVTEEESKTETKTVIDPSHSSVQKIDIKTNEDNQSLATATKKEEVIENKVAVKNNSSSSNLTDKKSSAKNFLPGLVTVKKAAGKIKKAKSTSIDKLNNMQGDGSTADLITLILLIILILIVFALLDELLGGLLTWILGIVILVLIIYFLLRLLGAI